MKMGRTERRSKDICLWNVVIDVGIGQIRQSRVHASSRLGKRYQNCQVGETTRNRQGFAVHD